MSDTQSIAALRPKIWQKELYQDVMDNLYFMKNGMMGKDSNSIIQIKDELTKEVGDTITYGLTAKLSGDGVDGDNELEGNEEAINAYSDSVAINQKRFGVRLKGILDEQTNAYDMRMDAKEKLSIRLQEFIERQFFLKMGGVRNVLLTDVAGNAVAGSALWSNSPAVIPAADEAAGFGARYLCADFAAGTDSLEATDLLSPALISRARVKAATASPKLIPLRINGKTYYVLFVHPWQAFDLKNNQTFSQAQREAQVRGDENPLFTGALGVWDGVIIHEHDYVPFLDISVAGYSFEGETAGTQAAVDVCRALLCGAQAGAFAKAKNPNGWVEKTFDYSNKTGFATGLIGGIQKITFNSKEYGVIAVDTAVTALV